MKPVALILTCLVGFAGLAHAQNELPVADQHAANILADLGVVQATLPDDWGLIRTDIKGGNPLLKLAARREGLWRPDSVQPLTVPDGTEPVETAIQVNLMGELVTLRLHPKLLQATPPIVMIQLPDGTLERYNQLPSNLYVGDVDRFPGSRVEASFRFGKLKASILLAPGVEWQIQPLSDLTEGGEPTLHMVWDSQNPAPSPESRCGNDDNAPNHAPHNQEPSAVVQLPRTHSDASRTMTIEQLTDDTGGGAGSPQGGEGGSGTFGERGNPWDAMLAIDVDCYLYDNYNNVQDTVDFVYEVINASNTRFAQRFAFVHLVTHILVRTSCANDPYQTTNPDNANQILDTMWGTVWNRDNPVPRNIAMLFTGRNLDNSIIGLANQGTACSEFDASEFTPNEYNAGHCLIEADWSPIAQARYTVAKHELAHTWNADHVCGTCCSGDYCSIMCASVDIVCTSTNTDFMSASINDITNYRATVSCNIHVGNVWYVDALNPYTNPNGNANHPFQSFWDGYTAAPDGGTVEVKGRGPSTEYINGPRLYVRPMTIRADGSSGIARIR